MKALFLSFMLLTSQLCHAQNFIGDPEEIEEILNEIRHFSEAVMAADLESIGNAYTHDAKLFPSGQDITEGREAIMAYWNIPPERAITHHHVDPVEIKVVGDEAYDYGYYEGSSLTKDGEQVAWRGKYVIIWKKVDDRWKIYLDIWNRILE